MLFSSLPEQLEGIRAQTQDLARGDNSYRVMSGGGGFSRQWDGAMVRSVSVRQDSQDVADQGPKPGSKGIAPPSEPSAPRGASGTINTTDFAFVTDRSLQQGGMDTGCRADGEPSTSSSADARPSKDGARGEPDLREPFNGAERHGSVQTQASGYDNSPGGERQPLTPDTYGGTTPRPTSTRTGAIRL